LKKELVDQEGDAEEQRRPIEPCRVRVRHQPALLAGRKALRRRLIKAEQGLAQPPAGKRERPGLQVGDAPDVGEQVVAVEAHEGAEVERERAEPRHGGDQEGGAAGRPVGKQAPEHGGQNGEAQLGDHPGCRHRHPLTVARQAPSIVGVSIEDRP